MDLRRIEALLLLLGEHDVCEFHYKDDEISLRLRLGPQSPVAPEPPPLGTPLPAPPRDESPSASGTAPSQEDNLVFVESPMVGMFYRSSSPGADPFVEVGDHVSPGSTLCVVEAMKLMNEIEAEAHGTLVSILVENAEPVQFGQALFAIRPD
ncbi:MAG: acetyl-CoA carboxylase biotin carboxyl carrier protein [Deltaproteobacteria bacterium]|nr:acetyl-CoA carboxylase biotin carboxyl carrier protein [Deltaproteobacteria bacterium]MBW2254732.1 acetyl-CoA carboxylase biotin carboxyl carrier protein [Deltaproteobacteria bacterium]